MEIKEIIQERWPKAQVDIGTGLSRKSRWFQAILKEDGIMWHAEEYFDLKLLEGKSKCFETKRMIAERLIKVLEEIHKGEMSELPACDEIENG
jgi:hypothetical protein